jgi:3-hydroxyacyl-CoA dehydrogenase
MIGLDVLLAVMQILHDEFADSKYRPCPLLKEMVAAGYLGRKDRSRRLQLQAIGRCKGDRSDRLRDFFFSIDVVPD